MPRAARHIFLVIFLSVIILFFSIKNANAQVGPSVNLIVTPQSVAPNQNVTFSVESFSFDINSATVSWYINGKLIKKAVGEKTFNVTVGKAGTATIVLAHIVATSGIVVDKTVTLRPNTVNLIWEAKTYTPPFYKGKALFTFQSDVRFSALATIIGKNGRISPQNLIYTWSVNGEIQGNKSGYGKNTLTVTGSIIPRPINVSVAVTTQDKTINASADISLAASSPQILFYENNPLYGIIYEHAIPNAISLKSKEIKMTAVPYFFSNASNLTYSWNVNNTDISPPEINSLTLRNTGDAGTSFVSLNIQNALKDLQGGRGAFSIQF
ncbi:hypothetical protein KW783_01365 [Candidatus Parcubacteria bacterium]|nr:hypothetical protein [Candidatus Parcubacteria bacterium]